MSHGTLVLMLVIMIMVAELIVRTRIVLICLELRVEQCVRVQVERIQISSVRMDSTTITRMELTVRIHRIAVTTMWVEG